MGSFLDGEGTYTLHGVRTSNLFYVICDRLFLFELICFLSSNPCLVASASTNLFGVNLLVTVVFRGGAWESVGGFG